LSNDPPTVEAGENQSDSNQDDRGAIILLSVTHKGVVDFVRNDQHQKGLINQKDYGNPLGND
jgi:hypothetical protein